MDLRPYQIDAVAGIRAAFAAGHKGVVLAAPTGSGKTIIAAEVIKRTIGKQNRVLFLAHREELLYQCSRKLTEDGVEHGITKAGMAPGNCLALTQLAGIQTAVRRRQIPPAELVIIDECHHVCSRSFRSLLARYPNAYRLGLTATPYRLDGQGLGEAFTKVVKANTVVELLLDGYLIRPRIFAPPGPDLRGLHKRGGDYAVNESAALCDRPTLVSDVVETWKRRASDRVTAVFAVNVQHSEHLVEKFVVAGVKAAHLDGEMPGEERRKVLTDLTEGRIQVVSNCMLLTEGWDLPACSCIVLARPTASRCLWRQMLGRGMRPFGEKEDCIVLDHASLTHTFGNPLEEDVYSLRGFEVQPREKGPGVKSCPKCYAVCASKEEKCPECGYVWEKVTALPLTVAGELGEMSPQWESALQRVSSPEARKKCFMRYAQVGHQKGYKFGWCCQKYRAIFGRWPEQEWVNEIEKEGVAV